MQTRKNVFLSVVGDANDPHTWSGTPYYLLQAGKRLGLITAGLDLSADSPAWKARRAAWNAMQIALHFQRLGGYQYSEPCLERLWRDSRPLIKESALINCFQLFPPSIVADSSIEKWFYIDMTLRQLFGAYGIARTIGPGIRGDALVREREGYRSAAGVICHSGWAADSVLREYGVAPERVHVVVPGANIDTDEYERWRTAGGLAKDEERKPGPLRLVAVGKEWRRKGLDRLLLAYRSAAARGARLSLTVIGCNPASLPAPLRETPDVLWAGFIDKRGRTREFLDLVGSADLGCHLSRAEAGGMVQREYHALGLAVIGTVVGGAAEHRIAGASVDLPVDASTDMIAAKLCELAGDIAMVERMKRCAREGASGALWAASVEGLSSIVCAREQPKAAALASG